MPMLALKAHFDGNAVILDEPCSLPPATPLVVVADIPVSAETSIQANRLAAFREVRGSMKGRLSGVDEFIARKTEEKSLEERSAR